MSGRKRRTRELSTPRRVSRRTFVVLGVSSLPALAGCTASARPCGAGDYSIRGIKNRELVGETVEVPGRVRDTFEQNSTGSTWFILDDASGTALVNPADPWVEKVPALAADRCVTVTGRVKEVYHGEYTSCVDPADGTCSFLTEDIRLDDATWVQGGS